MGLPQNFWKLSNKTIQNSTPTTNAKIKNYKAAKYGVPQETVFGPIIFLVYMGKWSCKHQHWAWYFLFLRWQNYNTVEGNIWKNYDCISKLCDITTIRYLWLKIDDKRKYHKKLYATKFGIYVTFLRLISVHKFLEFRVCGGGNC